MMREATTEAPAILNLRHLRVGPKILWSLQKPKHECLDGLWLGPTFTASVTLDAIVASLPPHLSSLDLDVTRLAVAGNSCAGGRPSSAAPFDWDPQVGFLVQGLPLSLTKLCLRFPKNDNAGILALAKALPSGAGTIQALDLRSNHLDDAAVRVLAAALAQTPSVRHLNLSMNVVAASGVTELAQALNSIRLESLDLSHNSALDDPAIEALGRALETNSQLEEINLVGCTGISNRGISVLLECLESHNFTLQRIHLKSKRPVRHDREQSNATTPQSAKESSQQRETLVQRVEYWLTLNRSGRRLVRPSNTRESPPPALWPRVLARKAPPSTAYPCKGPDALFFFLKQNPALLDHSLNE